MQEIVIENLAKTYELRGWVMLMVSVVEKDAK